ncbi:transposase [Streptomyces griseofuscus]|uniref:transposase n=2 Tax=Streptomyces griseofuscus TaxID=146922 RepID=UPI0037F85234
MMECRGSVRHREAEYRVVPGGRPPAFDREQYRRRNTVERCIGKLNQHRAVATRYDKREYIFNGTLATAAIVIWLRDLIKEPSDIA